MRRKNHFIDGSVLLVLLFLLSLASVAGSEPRDVVVPQFGTAFEEVVIADSSDLLSSPVDLEFHPSRSNELWIANKATDSITIIHDTSFENQTSERRIDSHRNHFLEEVSAIAFGDYHPEFDYTWGSAQETRNTYCGQASANNFMGPTLWPSSLSHFTVEHQNDQYLGSHIDMNHESPNGMGIAHDSGNVYWYNDGYYGELVYYDFQEDHDTGMDDHSDGIVRRYSDISLSRAAGIPGHMILDDASGILYIADAGANRIIWVNTDDSTYNVQNIMGDSSRLEPLAEYSRITGIEWGVLASGLSLPSGIALDSGRLFVSLNGNGQIISYDLSLNGRSATEIDSIQTSANSIMGLEIGPEGHLYYVDNGRNQVVRIDPVSDVDEDGVSDDVDNCPTHANPRQDDLDVDGLGDICDSDDDGDGVADNIDRCPMTELEWTSTPATDYDGDGCEDVSEDGDDDDDGVVDNYDSCGKGVLNWTSDSGTDYDGDGCADSSEDDDDDADLICDIGDGGRGCIGGSPGVDRCPFSRAGFRSTTIVDQDQDGCEDETEDLDDDDDGVPDTSDACPKIEGMATEGSMIGCVDADLDGWANVEDVYPVNSTQWADSDGDLYGDNLTGTEGDSCPTRFGNSSTDRFGCYDSDGDGRSDPDGGWTTADGADAFRNDATQWADRDGDEYGDNYWGEQADACPDTSGTSRFDRLGCLDSDGDGWSDARDAFDEDWTQWNDSDGDEYGDSPTGVNPDACPDVPGLSSRDRFGCPDRDEDGWSNAGDSHPDDARFWSDGDGDGYADQKGTNLSDDCPLEAGNSTIDLLGCLDRDGDGVSDEGDFYPLDARLSVEQPASKTPFFIGGILFVIILSSLLGLLAIRSNSDEDRTPPPAEAPSIGDTPAPIATPLNAPAADAFIDPYAQQLIEQGYAPEVAMETAAQYRAHAASHVPGPTFAPAPPADQLPPLGETPSPTASRESSHVMDYTGLPPNGAYSNDSSGATIYTTTDGTSWKMNDDQSFDRIS